MEGIWVRSQDETALTFAKTFEAWDDGRVVARYGKDFKVLGSYCNQEVATRVIGRIRRFIENRIEDGDTKVFNMPLKEKMCGGTR